MQSPCNTVKIICFLLGFFSITNALYFSFGRFNLRLFDVMFFVSPLIGVVSLFKYRKVFNNKILYGCLCVFLVYFWLVASGFLNYEDYSSEYKDYFLKYFVHKLNWIIIYMLLYFLYGKDILQYFLLGISVVVVVNSILVLFEYVNLFNGHSLDYSFLKSLFLNVEEKKFDVINQGLLRPTGLTMDPNYAAGYAGIGFIYIDYISVGIKRNKFMLIFFQLLCLLVMVILFSRTGIFSILLCFIISLYLHFMISKSNYKVLSPYLVLTIVFVIALMISYFSLYDDNFYEYIVQRFTMKDGSSTMRSSYLLSYVDKAGLSTVLFGTGTSSAGLTLSNLLGMNVGKIWSPESNYISFFIEQGALFVFLFLVLIVSTFFRLLKRDISYALIYVYINLIGISYNFLGDRVYFFLFVIFTLYAFSNNSICDKMCCRKKNEMFFEYE